MIFVSVVMFAVLPVAQLAVCVFPDCPEGSIGLGDQRLVIGSGYGSHSELQISTGE